jgi:hypothetical protein
MSEGPFAPHPRYDCAAMHRRLSLSRIRAAWYSAHSPYRAGRHTGCGCLRPTEDLGRRGPWARATAVDARPFRPPNCRGSAFPQPCRAYLLGKPRNRSPRSSQRSRSDPAGRPSPLRLPGRRLTPRGSSPEGGAGLRSRRISSMRARIAAKSSAARGRATFPPAAMGGLGFGSSGEKEERVLRNDDNYGDGPRRPVNRILRTARPLSCPGLARCRPRPKDRTKGGHETSQQGQRGELRCAAAGRASSRREAAFERRAQRSDQHGGAVGLLDQRKALAYHLRRISTVAGPQ